MIQDPGGNQYTVLIVDDTPANLSLVVSTLEDHGYRVLVAEDGAEGLERAEFAAPDIILLDVMMPGMNGFDTCRRLKAGAETRDIPVIFMTALSDLASKVEGFAAGAVDYVIKPLETSEVLWRLHTHLTARALQARLAAQNLQLKQEVAERLQAQSALHKAYEGLEESEERYRLLVDQSPDAIVIACDGAIVFVNGAAQRLFRANRADELLGRSPLSLVAPDCRQAAEAAMAALLPGEAAAGEEDALAADGGTVPVAVTRVAFFHRGRPAIQMVARDISEHRRLAIELHHQATHDALTGLPNRALLIDRLHQTISLARRHEGRFVVCFLDLDRFKGINDSLGHEAGDELLKTVAARMSVCLRESDTLARLGGDEFVLVLPDSGGVDAALQVISRAVAAVSRPLVVGGREVAVTCSVGCSAYPEDGEAADALLKAADAAMYRAKDEGRNNLQLYSAELRRQIDQRVRLETDLRRAIQGEGLVLRYQPQVDLASGAVAAMAAMPDWDGVAGAAEGIAGLAEEIGLGERLFAWTLRTACGQGRAWRDAGRGPVPVVVRLSPRQLERPGMEDRVAACLAESGLDAAGLQLELAEGLPPHPSAETIARLQRLRELGVSLALGRFGTGDTSLHTLKRLPVDWLKLDASFVADITADPDSLAVAEAIIAMAHHLGRKVVAERVGSEGQTRLLAARGCDRGQGAYFAAPLAADQGGELLARGALPLPD